MPRKGENIHKRKDGRWEARYIKGYDSAGKAIYGYTFGKSYLEVKRKRQENAVLPLYSLLSSAVPAALPTVSSLPAAVSAVGSPLPPITQIVQISSNISNCYKVENYENNVLMINDRADAASDNVDNAESRSPLLADIALQWLESLVSIRKKSTVVKYAGQLKNYILPAFGDKHIAAVTTTDLMSFSRWLLNEGRKDGKNNGHLSPRTVVNILAEMKSIKKFAVMQGFEVKYATECVEVPRQPALLTNHQQRIDCCGQGAEQEGQSRKKVLTVEEQKKLMNYLKETINDSMKDVKTDQKGWLSSFGIMLSLSTGIRLGELCALKWSDFSLEDNGEFGEFRIQRTMQRLPVSQMPAVPTTSGLLGGNSGNKTMDNAVSGETGSKSGKHNKKTAVEIGAPKSQCSIRTIPIPSSIMPYIRSAYEAAHQSATHNSNGTGGSEVGDAFLLTGSRERFTEPRTMENRFKTVLKKCGLRSINFHALRHSFATRAVELGFDVKTLSEILGHANVGITLDRYVHPSMRVKKENMDKMGNFLI